MSRSKDKKGSRASSNSKEVRIAALEVILEHADKGLNEEEIALLRCVIVTLAAVTSELEAKGVSIRRLRRLLWGPSTEAFRKIFPNDGDPPTGEPAKIGTDETTGTPPSGPIDSADGAAPEEEAAKTHDGTDSSENKKRKGHGRLSSSQYMGAHRVHVSHGLHHHGDLCPHCNDGRSKLYRLLEPAHLVRVTGLAPFRADLYEKERFRCHGCGQVFTAAAPDGVGEEKYDESVASMVAVFRYGTGIPFNRLEKLQKNLGVPLPAGTQWDLVDEAYDSLKPVHDELIREAAQGEVVHNDDTAMTILDLLDVPKKKPDEKPTESTASEPRRETNPATVSVAEKPAEEGPNPHATTDSPVEAAPADEKPAHEKPAQREIPDSRTGTFTSGIVSITGDRRIAMFFTGREHAGENLAKILRKRAAELGPPIHMSDALDRNRPPGFETIWANCMAHGRRKYVDVAEDFPEECRFILKTLQEVYRFDDEAREAEMTPEARLAYHQANSGPLMANLQKWFKEQLKQKRIEPNSELGKAIRYMTKPRRWERFTLFLKVPGVPLDNNICERAIKKSILHRKNSLFYKTEHGAEVGDLFMTLIHTCELNGVNPFDYLLALLKHEDDLANHPERWMPWNYKDRLA
jgi:transposase